MLDRLAEHYDVCHEALRGNKFLEQFSPERLQTLCVTDFSVRLVFFTINRLKSFKRAWHSFELNEPIKRRIAIDVFIDYDPKATEQDRTAFRKNVEAIVASRKEVRVIPSAGHLGWKRSYLEAWKDPPNNEFAIFLVSAEKDCSKHDLISLLITGRRCGAFTLCS